MLSKHSVEAFKEKKYNDRISVFRSYEELLNTENKHFKIKKMASNIK